MINAAPPIRRLLRSDRAEAADRVHLHSDNACALWFIHSEDQRRSIAHPRFKPGPGQQRRCGVTEMIRAAILIAFDAQRQESLIMLPAAEDINVQHSFLLAAPRRANA